MQRSPRGTNTQRVSDFEWWMNGILSGASLGGGISIILFGNPTVTGIGLAIVGALGFWSMYYSRQNA